MVAVKAHLAQKFLAEPDARLSAFLLYGTDPGQVSERARQLALSLAKRQTPEGELIRLDDSDLDTDRDRLGVELRTMPMFGGRKVVRVSAGRIINATVLKELVESDDLAGLLVVEAQNLKPSDTLRSVFEKSPTAAAIACYGDDDRDLDSLVGEVLDAAGLRIGREARHLLIERLGADRALSRSELEKLALHVYGRGEVTAEDIDEIVGDASELAVDRVVDAALSGDMATSVNEFARAVSSGESAQMIIGAIQRHLHRLHRARVEVDAGTGMDEALRALRPPLHFKARDSFAAQCRRWPRSDLERAIAASGDALKTARLNSELEEAIAERLLISLASQARR
ncbi:MAG: DNA polymerase III subunit delta [Hyphomicrobiaceae bacterium]